VDIHPNDPHCLPPCGDQKRAGNTATTDSRSQRIRADRRGGQITARALSPWSYVGLPALTCFQRPKPEWSHHNADQKISRVSKRRAPSYRITARPSASSRPACASGLMLAPTTPHTNEPPNCQDGFTVTTGKDLMRRPNNRTNRFNPNSSSQPPAPNPHSTLGTAAASPTAISCLGAFWSPAASACG
jgi:hypothetical protein